MKKVLMIYATSIHNVRLQKVALFLHNHGYKLNFMGWERYKDRTAEDSKFEIIDYLLKGGGEANKKLPLLYVIYLIKLFFKLLFRGTLNKEIVFAVNFESAYMVYLVSKLRKIHYIYEIRDEFAISHTFSQKMRNRLKNIDKKIRRCSEFYIHVDDNRLSSIDWSNHIIIYNAPYDIYDQKKEIVINYENSFAVTGWLNKIRGLKSIYCFAQDNPAIRFIIAGEFIDEDVKKAFLNLPNVEYHHFMPQRDLFELIKHCRGIFSLYDPSLEINKLAASNKLYDAMMLSVPVVVNNEIQAADMVRAIDMGYVINYDYDDSWSILVDFNESEARRKGKNGRKEYLEKYEFGKMLERKFLPCLESIS